MLFATFQDVGPVKDSLEPTIRIRAKVTYNPNEDLPVTYTARLRIRGSKFIGGTAQGEFGGSNVAVSVRYMLVPGEPSQLREHQSYVGFDFRLTSKEINLIQEGRAGNPLEDIHLTLVVQAQSLDMSLRAFPLRYHEFRASPQQKPMQLLRTRSADEPLSQGDTMILGGGSDAFRLTTHTLSDVGVDIPPNYWVRDFAPTFDLGRFMVVELPQLDAPRIADGDLAIRVLDAVEALNRMQDDILHQRWTECAEHSRPVLELLNKADLLRPLLAASGVTKENEEALLEGLRGVYRYAHAFHHRVGDDKQTVNPAVNAAPEDAYLVFTVTAGLLNLFARKLKQSAGEK